MTERELQAANDKLLRKRANMTDRLHHPLWPVYLNDAHDHWQHITDDTADGPEIDEMMDRFHKTFFSEIP